MMTLQQRILAVVGALALLGATLSTGLGYSDGRVDTSSVTILPGPLTANLTWISCEEQPEGTSAECQHGHLVLRVLDERGNVSGWNVSLARLDFPGYGGNLSAGKLALSPGAISTVRGNPDLAGHSTFGIDPIRTSPTLLWSVPELYGDGEYDLSLDMPGNQHRNSSSTLIVNIDGVAP